MNLYSVFVPVSSKIKVEYVFKGRRRRPLMEKLIEKNFFLKCFIRKMKIFQFWNGLETEKKQDFFSGRFFV